MLGISLKTAQLWSENGLLEAWRTEGGHRRIHRESVERLLFHGQADAGTREEALVPPRGAEFHILLAESDVAQGEFRARRMRAWRMKPKVTLVAGGIEALLTIGRQAPDLFIADVPLADVDGFRMLRALRGMPDFDRMAIAVVTALNADEFQAGGELPGNIRVFPKPMPFAEIERLAQDLALARRGA